jgi:hypothetical protein
LSLQLSPRAVEGSLDLPLFLSVFGIRQPFHFSQPNRIRSDKPAHFCCFAGLGGVLACSQRLIESWHNMNSNDQSSFYNRQPRPPYNSQPSRPFVQEDTLKSELIQIERKSFHLTLKENVRGRFLRITEEVGDRRNSIIIPSTGLAEFKKMLDEMVAAENGMTAKVKPVEPVVVPVVSIPVIDKPVKRTMSDAVKAKISAAAKARWAKIKAAVK